MNDSAPIDVQDVPMHRRIAEELSGQVRNGKLKPGEKLPSERQIARRFQASRATVRTALQHLEQTGLISRRERRSAIVTIRRDITPSLRIACSSPHIMNLFHRFSEMHILPPRSQLQLFDLQQGDSIQRLISQTTSAVDLMICGLEYAHCFRHQKSYYTPLPPALVQEARIPAALLNLCTEEGSLSGVPLAFWPMLLYLNEARFRDAQIAMPEPNWGWGYFQNLAQRLTFGGNYGFQFRPVFEHLAAIMAHRGIDLYQKNGHIHAQDTAVFEPALRLMSDLLHTLKVSPILAKVEQINLFAQHRCAMALDGYDQYQLYQQSLGHDLHVGLLPNPPADTLLTGGLMAVVMPGMENPQSVQDFLINLISINTQRMLTKISSLLPVREDLLQAETFAAQNLPEPLIPLLVDQVSRPKCQNLPGQTEHKYAVENLFLELWLGLDHIDNICQRFRSL
jgi:DNA-binding transcriptional regulator YhcF (GntR family)/ABC-type glycerol-3-phosphate transport system substrate-binding protein